MSLYQNNIFRDGKSVIFLNDLALNEYIELITKITENMLSDLSKITGLDKQVILKNYLLLNDFNPIREILKREGKRFDEQSIVLTILEKRK